MLVLMFAPAVIAAAFFLIHPSAAVGLGARIRQPWLVVVAAVANLAFFQDWYPSTWPVSVTVRLVISVSTVAVAAFVVLNWSCTHRVARAGLTVALLGAMCNALPQLALGEMPFSVTRARGVGIPAAELVGSPGHAPLTQSGAWYAPLSDVIPLPLVGKVGSIGDLLLIAGCALYLIGLGLASPAPRSAPARAQA
jgi:hypothetical protein